MAKQRSSTPLNIVLVGPAFPFRGGIAHFLSLLYIHLRRRHDVEIVTFSRQYPRFFFPGTSQKEDGRGGLVVPSRQLIDSLNPFSWITTARKIARTNPDLVIFMFWLPVFGICYGILASLVRRWSKAKVLFVCHNIIPHERRPGDLVFARYAFRYADFFITLSHTVADDLRLLRPGAPHSVVPHPVYESFGRASAKAAARKSLGITPKRVVLFFGIIRTYKGLKTLLSALPVVLESIKVHLYIVGEFYEEEEVYRKQIFNLGLTDHVTIVPRYVPRELVSLYFSACDVVILPYWTATQSGIAQIAYQFDKPVIATDVGGLSEVVRDNVTGFVVPPEDPDRLASAIVDFYRKKKEAAFVRGIIKEKGKYSWDNMVRAIEEFMGVAPGGKDKVPSSKFKSKRKTPKSKHKPAKSGLRKS